MIGYGDIDLNDLIDEDPPPSTKRLSGSAELVIIDRCDALFISATWTLVASTKDERGMHVIQQTEPSDVAHSASFIRRWSRSLVRMKLAELRRAGVDVEKTYVSLGGDLSDLDGMG